MSEPACPFVYGPPVSPSKLVGRKKELSRIQSRILSGQSTAIIGEPRLGKTSLLMYLISPQGQAFVKGKSEVRLLFSYIDAQASLASPADFWRRALHPLDDVDLGGTALAARWKLCKDSAFDHFALRQLLVEMSAAHWRLVLLVDEFDTLVHHRVLNSSEFFGGFRALCSNNRNRSRLLLDGEFRPILAIEPNLPSSSAEPPGLLVEIPP